MSSKKVDATPATPIAWVDLLDEHDAELSRVRLLWRCGKGRYRPILPATLESASMADWDGHEPAELGGSNPDVAYDVRYRSIEGSISNLWPTLETGLLIG